MLWSNSFQVFQARTWRLVVSEVTFYWLYSLCVQNADVSGDLFNEKSVWSNSKTIFELSIPPLQFLISLLQISSCFALISVSYFSEILGTSTNLRSFVCVIVLNDVFKCAGDETARCLGNIHTILINILRLISQLGSNCHKQLTFHPADIVKSTCYIRFCWLRGQGGYFFFWRLIEREVGKKGESLSRLRNSSSQTWLKGFPPMQSLFLPFRVMVGAAGNAFRNKLDEAYYHGNMKLTLRLKLCKNQ